MRSSKTILAALIGALLAGSALAQLAQTGAGSSGTVQFFVSTSGSDSNPGTQAQPWQTITKVNSSATAGSIVNLNGGQTFSTTTGITVNVSVTSYGTGQATISSGNSAPCISMTNPLTAVSITNVVCTGGGNTTNTTNGIVVTNSQSGNTKLPGPTISGNTVSGYGEFGILVVGTSGTSGFNNTVISNNTVHDVTGNYATSGGSSCIEVHSSSGYGTGTTTPSHTNVTITGNVVYNCTGTTGQSNWVGSGIVVGETSGATVSNNIAHDFGANSTYNGSGAGGIWTVDSTAVTISFNECYNGMAGSGGIDGGCFDLDGGVTNSVMEYNYAHDCTGWSYLLDNYQDSANLPHGNNTIRFNIGQNCGRLPGGADGEMGLVFQRASSGPEYIYNNTFYNQISGVIISDAASTAARTVTISNNLLLSSIDTNMLNITTPSSITMTGNDYYTYGRPISLTWSGTTYTSFAAWQTATGQEKIGGVNVGLTSNPSLYVPGGGFINGGNGYVPAKLMAYNLQSGSAMIGAGINLQTQYSINPGTQDFYGTAISASSLPVGAANGDFSTFAASCTAATNYLARVSSFTKADNVNYNSLICGMGTDGDFALLDGLWMLAAPNQAASELNLVGTSFSLTANGGITFTARAGTAFNGTTGYYDPGYVPSTSGVNYTLNSGTLGVYDFSTSTPATLSYVMGGNDTTGNNESSLIAWETGSVVFGDVNSGGAGVQSTTTNSAGMTIVQRTAAAVNAIYKNGSQLATSTDASTALPNRNIFIGAYNSHGLGGAGHFSADTFGAAFIGGGVNPYNVSRRLNSFTQAYGINTY